MTCVQVDPPFEFQKLCRRSWLLRTSRLTELIPDCFEPQFNHTVFIFHTLKWDLLNLRSFVGEAENIKDFLSDLSYSGLFQWSSVIHTVCIYHTLIRDLLNSKSFVGDTENIIKAVPVWLSLFLKLNLIKLCFICHTLNLYCY